MRPHGQIWQDKGELLVDSAANEAYNQPARINFPQNLTLNDGDVDIESYFTLLFPMSFLSQSIVPLTNGVLQSRHQVPTTTGEILKFFGLSLAMALDSCKGGIDIYWSQPIEHENTVILPRNFGQRFGMARDRFKLLRTCLTFSLPPHQHAAVPVADPTAQQQPTPDADPWWPIRPFIEAFNESRKVVITPGAFLTVDEIMSMWYGKEQTSTVEGIPHKTKITRKPRGVGAELKAICDGDTNIMLGVEMLEGAARQATKEYHQSFGAGASVVMRLASHWAGSGRTIIADSAFSSVVTLIGLFQFFGLFFMGVVKTAHKRYPLTYFQQWYADGWDPNPRREVGSHKVLQVSSQRKFPRLFVYEM